MDPAVVGRDALSSQVDRLEERAKFIRMETVRLARIAGAGHYTSVFSIAEILSTLYYSELSIDPKNPGWADRDRVVLSKGHAAIGLYPVLADLGYFSPSLLDSYTRFGSPFGDHPDMKKVPGIDFSSGSLGHGLSIGVGMALSARLSRRTNRNWVLLGDGELNEGQVWEAAMAAAHYRLGNLIAVVDNNQLSIDGFTERVMNVESITDKFASFGWDTHRVDGHDVRALLDGFARLAPADHRRPQVIVCDTVKGRGVRLMEFSPDWHVGNLVGEDYDSVMAELERGLRDVKVRPA
jgi:transketolase